MIKTHVIWVTCYDHVRCFATDEVSAWTRSTAPPADSCTDDILKYP